MNHLQPSLCPETRVLTTLKIYCIIYSRLADNGASIIAFSRFPIMSSFRVGAMI